MRTGVLFLIKAQEKKMGEQIGRFSIVIFNLKAYGMVYHHIQKYSFL